MVNKFKKTHTPFKVSLLSKIGIILLAITIISGFSCSYAGVSGIGKENAEETQGIRTPDGILSDDGKGGSGADDTVEPEKEVIVVRLSRFIPEFISAVLKHKARELFGEVIFIDEETKPEETSPVSGGGRKQAEIIADIAKNDESLNNYIVLCAVSNFFSSRDNIEFEEIEGLLTGSDDTDNNKDDADNNKDNTDNNTENQKNGKNRDLNTSDEAKLYISNDIGNIFKKFYGEIVNENVVFADTWDIVNEISQNTEAIALIAFDNLEKDLKVLNVNGKSIFSKEFSYSDYPLSFSVSFNCEKEDHALKLKEDFEEDYYSNMDPEKLATVNMTGVTALVRGVANRMDKKGILYPAEKIAETLKDADITHISNEISFKENCNAGQSGTVFCSKPEYIELLRFVGTDIVELTGNHLNDYSSRHLETTIKMYDEEGWKYFGGGMNLNQSKRPALFEINGNKIAFLGFNYFGPSYDWATETQAGSAPPDDLFYIAEINRLKDAGYNVIFTFQYEEAYQYSPLAYQIDDFRVMRDAGADIVSGSQAHHPMGLELDSKGLICYGLGNLFFDQMQSLGTRQGFIAKHIFYDNKHISTQIIPTLIEDYCQPRLMDDSEREDFLKIIYNKSIKS
ncbi:MAG TPA: CapA family protein [Actinobacteria bacterium]|nr:CapA family protein [Actinomycetota bacterium]